MRSFVQCSPSVRFLPGLKVVCNRLLGRRSQVRLRFTLEWYILSCLPLQSICTHFSVSNTQPLGLYQWSQEEHMGMQLLLLKSCWKTSPTKILDISNHFHFKVKLYHTSCKSQYTVCHFSLLQSFVSSFEHQCSNCY